MEQRTKDYLEYIILPKLLTMSFMLGEANMEVDPTRKTKEVEIVKDDLIFLIKIIENKIYE